MNQLSDRLPKYAKDKAPLVEVVASVWFQNLAEFRAADVKGLWDALGGEAEFPNYSEQPIIAKLPLHNPESIFPRIQRQWFISEDEARLVQFQLDCFCYNWQKKLGHYPHYDYFFSAFSEKYKAAVTYIQNTLSVKIIPEMQELTYVNMVDLSAGKDSFEEVSKYFKEPFWVGSRTALIGSPSAVGASWRFDVGDINATGIIEAKTVQLVDSGSKKLRIELSVKGKSIGNEPAQMREWCDKAHAWLVTAFDDMLTEGAHKEWGRYYEK